MNAEVDFFAGSAGLTERDDYSAKDLKEWCEEMGLGHIHLVAVNEGGVECKTVE